MPGLSILIPVQADDADPTALVTALAAKPDLDIEILVVPENAEIEARLGALSGLDARLRLVAAAATPGTLALWSRAVGASSGKYLTLVHPDDIIEPEALRIVDFVLGKLGRVDAIGWNALQVSPTAEPGKSPSVAIPTKFDVTELDKTEMLKAFFLWEGSFNIPKMPFGLYHGILSRELATTIADTIANSGRDHDLAQWEWAARAVLMGEKFVFCSRPLSVINSRPYQAPARPLAQADFPFHAGIGLTAGLAEIQHAVFAEMGAQWTGTQENFIRACVIDCMLESEPQRFNDKCNAYFRAIKAWEGGQHAGLFKPQFAGERPIDRRRGLHGNLLMIDRHIAGARNAQEFYGVIRNFLVPVGIMCGQKAG